MMEGARSGQIGRLWGYFCAFLHAQIDSFRAESLFAQGLSRGRLTSFQQLAPSTLAKPMPSCRNCRAGDGCPRVRAGVRAGEHLPPSSCSADCHSPGKQTAEHSLLSSAFMLAMSKSLLLSHTIPRNANVLWPVTELRQLERTWLCFSLLCCP